MSLPRPSLRTRTLLTWLILPALAACEPSLPTAGEIEAMDVAALETGAQQLRILSLEAEGETVYTIDGVTATAEEARALGGEAIAQVEVRRLVRDGASQAEIAIVTRQSAGGEAPGAGGARIHWMQVGEGSGEAGLVFIDGVRADPSALRALRPEQITSVEVLKGEAAAALYSEPEAAQGVIRITTRNR
jgi:outer membrane receptor protein involved in Fe transport